MFTHHYAAALSRTGLAQDLLQFKRMSAGMVIRSTVATSFHELLKRLECFGVLLGQIFFGCSV